MRSNLSIPSEHLLQHHRPSLLIQHFGISLESCSPDFARPRNRYAATTIEAVMTGRRERTRDTSKRGPGCEGSSIQSGCYSGRRLEPMHHLSLGHTHPTPLRSTSPLCILPSLWNSRQGTPPLLCMCWLYCVTDGRYSYVRILSREVCV